MEATTRADGLPAGVTLEEKGALTVGRNAWITVPVERLEIPSVWLWGRPDWRSKLHSSRTPLREELSAREGFQRESSLGWAAAVDVRVKRSGAAVYKQHGFVETPRPEADNEEGAPDILYVGARSGRRSLM